MSTHERGFRMGVLVVSAAALWFLMGPGVPQPTCAREGSVHVVKGPEGVPFRDARSTGPLSTRGDAAEPPIWELPRLACGAPAEARHVKTRTVNLNMALIGAAQQGKAAETARLLDRGADVNARVGEGDFTALIWAASKGHADAVKVLLERGAQVNATTSEGQRTALAWATNQGFATVVKLLLENGADPNVAETIHHLTPLRDAAGKGRTQIVRIVLEGKANVNAADPSGNTALMLAARKGRADTVALLLEKGADLNALNKHGQTALKLAISSGHKKVAALLGQKEPVPAEVARPVDRGKKPEREVKREAPRSAEPGEVDLDTRDEKNYALLAAASSGDAARVEQLLAKGADVNFRDLLQNTPLISAATNGHLEAARILLERGADVNAVQMSGLNALHWATEGRHKALEELLLARGATAPRITAQKAEAKHPKTAVTKPPERVATAVATQKARSAPPPEETARSLIRAVKQGDEKELTRLLDQGANVNARDTDGSTALMWSCASSNCLRVAKLLVARGAEVNAKDNSGKTALTRADDRGALTAADQIVVQEFKEFLLQHGAVDEQLASLKDKNRVLLVASGKGYVSVVKRLVQEGGDVNHKGNLGQTPLIEASGAGYAEIVRFLLEKGANPRLRDGAGNSALTYATNRGHKEIQLLLQQALANSRAAPASRPEGPSSPSAGKKRLGGEAPGTR
ncbi:MAG: ankyrin repeat domain-containing protein [Desulfomonile tiedjei]|nr:ankyrin repeat domain-containing protein [Desulfomonile tiedjei]